MWVGPPDRRGGFCFDFIMLVFAGFETDGLSLWRQKTSDQNRNRTDDNKAFKYVKKTLESRLPLYPGGMLQVSIVGPQFWWNV